MRAANNNDTELIARADPEGVGDSWKITSFSKKKNQTSSSAYFYGITVKPV